MNRAEYMKELAYLLQDVPDEEKEEALQYYKDYFDDAGVENEAQVISELGRPEKIAAIIREGARNGYENQDAEYTEAGYRNERYRSPQYEVVPPERCRKDTIEDKNDSREESSCFQKEDYQDASYRRMEEETGQSEDTWQESSRKYENDTHHQTFAEEGQDRRPVRRRFSLLMWILVILGFLMISPLLLGGAGVVFGIAVTIVVGVGGVALAVILIAVVLLVVSVILIGVGIAKLLIYPIAGIMICGAGLVLLSIGMFFTWLSVLFCGKAVPGIIHMIGNFFNFLSRRLRRGGAAA
ncbi:DUF1700 domain-containing protein [Lacrimispora sp. NSJ-141]|uniref:DUF1700 domain-containing protein n=1 Tax=Lientehia hominis TaxID=2897778 RepID=A0AAP2W6V2_9FIRM|nr:DUF1700 domain-containing protein [Lientehia hominis]MCD2491683.1 DUF1700 domain-containing protein [Lientehia hominis]